MRRAFTLIELLAVVAIIAAMVTVGVVSILSGRQAAQTKAAARDVYAAINNARSRAIVTGNRVVVNFSNEKIDGENAFKIEVDSALVMNAAISRKQVQEYYITEYKELTIPQSVSSKTESEGEGDSIEDVLFSSIGEKVTKGMCIRFKKGDNIDANLTEAQRQSGISVYSTTDYWLQKYAEKKGVAKVTTASEDADAKPVETKPTADLSGMEDSGAVVWETNGSVDPHQVWVYPEGTDPADGLVLAVDRFGGVKIRNADGSDQED